MRLSILFAFLLSSQWCVFVEANCIRENFEGTEAALNDNGWTSNVVDFINSNDGTLMFGTSGSWIEKELPSNCEHVQVTFGHLGIFGTTELEIGGVVVASITNAGWQDLSKKDVSTQALYAKGNTVKIATISGFGASVAHFSVCNCQPTSTPTTAPASAPTLLPTPTPTSQPTSEPWHEPSSEPSFEPSFEPTFVPTGKPSSEPSFEPTYAPTGKPSEGPTSKPTEGPTAVPSEGPSFEPTFEPTYAPTGKPSERPTSKPTEGPTAVPSFAPSGAPTAIPVLAPTSKPTEGPTAVPSLVPSGAPTAIPAPSPTAGPSEGPTAVPSLAPWGAPTAIPAPAPTAGPTEGPTAVPSLAPSGAPTAIPAPAPTEGPTAVPTAVPSLAPSGAPTAIPAPAPTAGPTKGPTAVPSLAPSGVPTASPTNEPTSNAEKKTGSPGSCFHGDSIVLLESGLPKRFSELGLGERIKTSDGQDSFSFNPVLALPHAKNKEPAAFLTLTTETGKKVDMTSDHLIPRCDLNEVTAGELVVGDCLLTADGKETLIEISSTAKNGIYTAITEGKYIVVDSVVASSFSKDPGLAKPEQDYDQYRIQLEEMRRRQLAREPKKRLRGTPLDALVD